jgi:hypothetical protein
MSTTVPYGNDRFHYKDENVSNVTLAVVPSRAGRVPVCAVVRAGLGTHDGASAPGLLARLAGPVRSPFSAKDVAVLDRPVGEN